MIFVLGDSLLVEVDVQEYTPITGEMKTLKSFGAGIDVESQESYRQERWCSLWMNHVG